MDKTIIYNGQPLFYKISGMGKPVVLLHGFAEDNTIWNEQIECLEKSYQLIIPDLPGSGRSALTTNISMETMAEAVKAILEEEKTSAMVMIGHSMGGYVTLAFAEKYPESLTSFGLFHSTAYPDNEEKKAARKKNIAFIRSHGTYEFLKQSIPTLFSSGFKKAHPEVVNGIIERYRNFNPESLVAYYEAMMQRPDRTEVLRNFNKPILFVIGKEDNAVPFNDSLQFCHLAALSYIHILDKSGHMGMLEEKEKSNDILREFLKDTVDD